MSGFHLVGGSMFFSKSAPSSHPDPDSSDSYSTCLVSSSLFSATFNMFSFIFNIYSLFSPFFSLTITVLSFKWCNFHLGNVNSWKGLLSIVAQITVSCLLIGQIVPDRTLFPVLLTLSWSSLIPRFSPSHYTFWCLYVSVFFHQSSCSMFLSL